MRCAQLSCGLAEDRQPATFSGAKRAGRISCLIASSLLPCFGGILGRGVADLGGRNDPALREPPGLQAGAADNLAAFRAWYRAPDQEQAASEVDLHRTPI